MDIHAYINEIEEAAEKVFEALNADTAEIATLRESLSLNQHEAEEWMKASMTFGGLFGDYADPQREWAKAMRHYDAARSAEKEIQDRMIARSMSLGALSGAILQFAKQGLSMAYGGKGSVPGGRLVGTQPLREVIWEGRNHYMHWEERQPRSACDSCMDTLNADFGNRVHNYRNANVSIEVLDILGWTNFESFADDLRSFDAP